jgi:hypothetical protein
LPPLTLCVRDDSPFERSAIDSGCGRCHQGCSSTPLVWQFHLRVIGPTHRDAYKEFIWGKTDFPVFHRSLMQDRWQGREDVEAQRDARNCCSNSDDAGMVTDLGDYRYRTAPCSVRSATPSSRSLLHVGGRLLGSPGRSLTLGSWALRRAAVPRRLLVRSPL